jgi:hypothetical protein
MKNGFLLATLVCVCLNFNASRASDGEEKKEASKIIVAVEMVSQAPVQSGSLLTTGKREKTFIDRDNMQVVLGPQSVGEFGVQGDFRLLRGSAYIESKKERAMRTTNVAVDFIGRILISFDHREKATSCFVLNGEARIKNPFEEQKTIRISRHQGATLVTGDVYPTLVRRTELAKTDEWLKGYFWSQERREIFLRELPSTANPENLARADTSEAAPSGIKKNPLSDYYSAIYEERGVPAQHEEYKAVDEGKPGERNVEIVKTEVIMSPENAAIIALPDTKIDLGFVDILSDQEINEEKNASPALRAVPVVEPSRKIASLPSPRRAPAPRTLSAEEQVLARLRKVGHLESPASPVERASRSPASVSPQQKMPPKRQQAGIIPDPVYDLSENF